MANYPKLAFTCPMKWDDMRGDERERLCSQCNRTVVNLSRLSAAQRAALLASAPPGQLCVAYRQRLADQRHETAGPARTAKPRRLLRWGAAAAFVGALVGVANHATTDRSSTPHPWESATDSYYSIRYTVETWVDEVRVFFGGTPKVYPMVLGMVCEPPAPASPPAPMAPTPAPSQGVTPPAKVIPAPLEGRTPNHGV